MIIETNWTGLSQTRREVIVGSCSFRKWVQKGKLSTRKVIVVFLNPPILPEVTRLLYTRRVHAC